jgi:hypothetical protein
VKKLIIIFAFLATLQVQGQIEELGMMPLRLEQAEISGGARSTQVPIRYLLRTLDLPVRDDFSKWKIKVFPTDINHPSVFDSLSYLFTANGQYDSVYAFRRDTVYNFTLNPFTGNFDSLPANTVKIVYFTDSLDPYKPTDSIAAYPAFSLITQNGITRKKSLSPDSILYNKTAHRYFARDDNFSIWVSKGPFFNRTMAIDPPSIGFLTFDGLDSNGLPYDNTSSFPYGTADYLTSKPINLTGSGGNPLSVSDSVYLSFFYQPGGHGDRPEDRDSLILQFYAPDEDRWSTVWSLPGAASGPFQEVKIYINQTRYLKRGFRFRFFNYATLSGNFDHWHLDYIYLDKNRQRIEDIKDWAVVAPIVSYIRPYSMMPWTHFRDYRTQFISDTVKLRMRNLSITTDISRARYKVYQNGALNFFYQSTENLFSSVPSKSFYTIPLTVSAPPNSFNFPTDTAYRKLFRIVHHAFSTQDVYRENDTLVHDQIFDTFYSYDDGTAEKTYNANRPGTDIQVEFSTPMPDTLRAVLINFINTFEILSFQQVNIRVFKDLNSAPLWESGPIDVIYQPAGKFTRYNIPGGLVVEGTFYVGWQQLGQEKTYVGFDVNTNNKQRNFYSYLNNWYNSDFDGTLLVRADFGDGLLDPLSEAETLEQENIKLFPNPAFSEINISLPQTGTARVEVLDLGGRTIFHHEAVHLTPFNISHIQPGIYLFKVQTPKEIQVHKVVIGR